MATTAEPQSDAHLPSRGKMIAFAFIALFLTITLLRKDFLDPTDLAIVVGGGALGICPPIRRKLSAILNRLSQIDPTERAKVAVAVAVVSGAIILVIAYAGGWDFILRYQDEHSYMVQLQMLSRGRLWMPGLPPDIADFFDAHALFTRGVYGSIYFPGTALLFVPTIWLGLPFWVLPLITASACIGLTYRILAELVDGTSAMLAAIAMAALPAYRSVALMLLSQTPTLLAGLLLIFCYLKWRTNRRWSWELAIGFLAGWALIARPVDGLAYILPIGVGMLFDLLSPSRNPGISSPSEFPALGSEAQARRGETRGAGLSAERQKPPPLSSPGNTGGGRNARGAMAARIASTFFRCFLAATPMLAILLIQNHGMTGHWFKSPYVQFVAENYPGPPFGFSHIDWSHVPTPRLQEDQEMIVNSFWPAYRDHQPSTIPALWWNDRLPKTLLAILPCPLFSILIGVGLMGLNDRRRRVVAATLICFLLLYVFSVFYQRHYLMAILPGAMLLLALGIHQIRLACPCFAVAIALIVAGLSIHALLQIDTDNWSPWIDLSRIEAKLTTLPPGPAVVLFRYHPNDPAINYPHHEPVYNTTTAWPDDAAVIRVHNLGPENIRLFRYYARTQPQRQFYLYDRDGDVITPLGDAAAAEAKYNIELRSTHGG